MKTKLLIFLKTFRSKDLIIFLLLFFASMVFLIFLFSNLSYPESNQFTELARSFVHGKLYFLEDSVYNQNISDNVSFSNHYYWPLGPFPAVILIPFLLLFLFLAWPIIFVQGFINFFLVLLTFFLVFKISQKNKYTREDSFYWSMAFVFASVFAGVAFFPFSWFFAHTVSVVLVLLSFWEYFNKKRFWLIGLIMGLVLLTRVTAFLAILFFVFDVLFLEDNIKWKLKIRRLVEISIFPVISLSLLLLYNYLRFGNCLDQGYVGQILSSGFMLDKDVYGLSNLKYLPRGLYYSLISMPFPVFNSETHLLVFPFIRSNHWGMSIFFTSPYLLLLFFLKNSSKKSWFLILNSLLIAFVILSSFFIGYVQFGFRYSLDFFPLLFLALMLIYNQNKNKISNGLKLTIIFSTIVNLYLLILFYF